MFGEIFRRRVADHPERIGCPVAAAALARPEDPDLAAAATAAFQSWERPIAAALRTKASAPRTPTPSPASSSRRSRAPCCAPAPPAARSRSTRPSPGSARRSTRCSPQRLRGRFRKPLRGAPLERTAALRAGCGNGGEDLTPRRAPMALACLAAALLASAALVACGGSSSGSGPRELTFFVAIQPGGTIEEVSERCSKESDGKYTINPEFLPTDATQQREQLVRRLGAEDPSIDIVGMDVIWTGEFANAGWVEEWTGALKKQVTEKVFPNVIETASFEAQPLRRPVQHQHAAALVPQRPGEKAARDLGRDDRTGRKAEGSRHDPGPGQPLRGLHGLGQRADRKRRHADPLRAGNGRPRTGADRKGAGGDGAPGQLLGRAAGPLDLRRGQRPARLRGGRIGLHDQLHLRLRERPGRSAGNRQGDGLRPLPAGRREQAQQTAAGRLQPRRQLLLEEQGRRLRSGRLPGRRRRAS